MSSPSGAGKTTLTRRLLEEFKPELEFSVSYTTRPRRSGRGRRPRLPLRDARDRSRRWSSAREFAEHAFVFNNRYGTAQAPIEAALAAGRDVIFDVDWQGGAALSERWPRDSLKIFILPPDLRSSRTGCASARPTSPSHRAPARSKANDELGHFHEYQHLIVNDDLERAYERAARDLPDPPVRRGRPADVAHPLGRSRQVSRQPHARARSARASLTALARPSARCTLAFVVGASARGRGVVACGILPPGTASDASTRPDPVRSRRLPPAARPPDGRGAPISSPPRRTTGRPASRAIRTSRIRSRSRRSSRSSSSTSSSICAGLLHDCVEDTSATVEQLGDLFGKEVAFLVDGVTKLGKLPYSTREEQQAENFRKMLLAMARDIRVILVKLCDRLDNMRSLNHLPPEKQERIAAETMQIYAPLANRLGIQWVKVELEDLAFKYLLPRRVRAARDRRREDARRAARVHPPRREAHPEGDERQRRAVRGHGPRQAPVVDLPEDEAHAAPVRGDPRRHRLPRDHRHADALLPGPRRRAPDVDADPGPLQGLHRAAQAEPLPVAAHGGDRAARRAHRDPDPHRRHEPRRRARHRGALEVQGGQGRSVDEDDKKFAWLRQLMESQKELRDPTEFLESVKIDLFGDEVYVFTPGGDVKALPKGSCPIDFAYAVHSSIGDHPPRHVTVTPRSASTTWWRCEPGDYHEMKGVSANAREGWDLRVWSN